MSVGKGRAVSKIIPEVTYTQEEHDAIVNQYKARLEWYRFLSEIAVPLAEHIKPGFMAYCEALYHFTKLDVLTMDGMRTLPRSNYVYIIREQRPDSPFKIGKTVNPRGRLWGYAKLPYSFDLVCIMQVDDCTQAERALHNHFKANRLNGEWFSMSYLQVSEAIDLLQPVKAWLGKDVALEIGAYVSDDETEVPENIEAA